MCRSLSLAFMLLVVLAHLASANAQDSERKIRNVTPDGIPVIILPPRVIERPPAKELAVKGEPKLIAVQADGSFLIGEAAARLSGVSALASERLCARPDGSKWACGLRAYVAIREFLHGKEPRCEATKSASDANSLTCHLDGVNVSQWLLANGWSLADADAPAALATAAAEARAQQRGIWADGSSVLGTIAQ